MCYFSRSPVVKEFDRVKPLTAYKVLYLNCDQLQSPYKPKFWYDYEMRSRRVPESFNNDGIYCFKNEKDAKVFADDQYWSIKAHYVVVELAITGRIIEYAGIEQHQFGNRRPKPIHAGYRAERAKITRIVKGMTIIRGQMKKDLCVKAK